MMNKMKELRLQVPVPMGEALQLLKENGGDVEQCIYLFKAKSIAHIMEQTGCDEAMANKFYNAEKFDVNRAISFINDEIYDQNYQPIGGLTLENLRKARQWLGMLADKELAFSLDYLYIDTVVETMALIPSLQEMSQLLDKAHKAKVPIFEGYTDELPMAEFVRRNQELDNHPDFQHANAHIPLRAVIINEELLRHIRNLNK